MSDAPRVPDDAATDLAEQPDLEPAADEAADDLDIEEPDSELEPPDDDGEPEPAAARPTRGENRIQRLARERDEARREAAELRGYRQALETQQPRQQAPAVDPQAQMRALTERWSMMAPHEAIAEALQYGAQQQQQQLLALKLHNDDRVDKQSYELRAQSSPSYQRYAQEVERELAQWRSRGVYDITRQQIYFMLTGRDGEQRATRTAPVQRRAAAARVASQQARPTGARSDGARTGGRPQPGSAEDDDRIIAEGFAAGLRI